MVKRSSHSFGLTAMAVFLVFGATMATLAGITLLFPGSFLDSVWRLNPEAGEQLRQLGRGIGIAFLGLGCGDGRCRDRMDQTALLGLGARSNYHREPSAG